MRRLAILAFLASPGILACQGGVPVEQAVASITEADFLHKVGVIAHDSMMGRANPSPGLDMTAQWIASEFERYGLKPGGDGTGFIQSYHIGETATDFEASSAQVTGGPVLEFGTDLNFMRASGGGEVTGTALVLVGDLASAQDLPADQISGKHIFILPSASAAPTGRRRIRLPSGVTDAQPASVIFVDQSSDEDWGVAVERARNQRQRVTPWADASGGGLPMLNIRQSSLEPLLAAHGVQLSQLMARAGGAATVIDVPNLEISITTVVQDLGGFDMPNAVGILEGSDPELKNEYIVFSGHMDHVGVGQPNEAGDSIRNGADDDGSGTIAVVELAEAFAMLADPPKRSIIFLAVSGEESGLWGSRFFAENPSVSPEQLVANLNADMISRNATDTIVVIGKEHSDLGETMNRVNAAHPELNLTAADDIWPEQNFYQRSDHFNFARRGVPVLFFFCGTTEDYHGVDDEVEKMDITKATNTTRLMFYLGLELGNAAEKPQWNPDSYAEIVDMGR
ncbi:MAG: M20/M25/M40 family metallo-hydrolase [Gemmatimonadota bacterium]